MFDISKDAAITTDEQLNLFEDIKREFPQVPIIRILNKVDLLSEQEITRSKDTFKTEFQISTKEGIGIDNLISFLEDKTIKIVKTAEKFKESQKIAIAEEFLSHKEEEIDYEF
jgi:GTP1/Obg family GTP-binding protein